MTSLRRIAKQFKSANTPPKPREFWAFLGDKSGTIKADNYGMVYIIDYGGNVMKVYNERVPLLYRRPVIVGYRDAQSTRLEVLRFVDAYPSFQKPSVPNHAEAHQWGEHDILWSRMEQLLTCGLAIPDNASLIVEVVGGWFYLDGFHVLSNQTIDFTDEVTAVTGAYYVLVEVDSAGVIYKRAGSEVGVKEMLVPSDIPTLLATRKALFACVIYSGQTKVQKLTAYTDIIDMRFAGISSGGLSTAIDWSDIINVPSVFPPDTAITDPLYVRKFDKFTTPTVDDDEGEGYLLNDLWHDITNRKYYIAHDVTDGAADWFALGSSSGVGGTVFAIDGVLAVCSMCTSPVLITSATTINEWIMYLNDTGSLGDTILDVILYRVGEAPISIFTDASNDARPIISYSDADGLVTAIPLITDFLAGDILICNIDEISTDASDTVLAGVVSSGVASVFNLIIEESDGVPSVENVGKIKFENAVVVDETGGVVKVTIPERIIQVVDYHTGAAATGTTLMPVDDTIPQNTEGTEFMTLAITPTDVNHKLCIDAKVYLGSDTADRNLVVAIFQDTTANAIAVGAQHVDDAASFVCVPVVAYVTAGTTSPTTFKIRCGSGSAATITFNGHTGVRKFGGVMASHVTITEISE